MKRWYLLLAWVIAGCSSTVDLSEHFHEEDFAWSTKAGTAKLTGQAFVKTMGGDVKYCAGNEVYLVPGTRYADALTNMPKRANSRVKHPEGYAKYRRTTIGDGMGNFEFTNLPAGRWYVGCVVAWVYDAGMYTGTTGALAEAMVTLAEGESKRVVVTPSTMPQSAP